MLLDLKANYLQAQVDEEVYTWGESAIVDLNFVEMKRMKLHT